MRHYDTPPDWDWEDEEERMWQHALEVADEKRQERDKEIENELTDNEDLPFK